MPPMQIFYAVILGIVEGISEFLPISSTGHLILAARILNISQSDFIKSFEVIIQLGAILSVIVLYFRFLCANRKIINKLIAAFIPTGITGLLFYKIIKKYFLGSTYIAFWALLLGGIFIIVFELLYKEKQNTIDDINSISYKQAVIIGLFQSVAIIPGVSRSAATIIGGLLLGLKRKTIVKFSFLLAIPTMLAAAGLDLFKSASNFSHEQVFSLGIGFITSFIVAIFAIKFLLSFIQKHSFIVFGVYRIIIALLFLLVLGFNT